MSKVKSISYSFLTLSSTYDTIFSLSKKKGELTKKQIKVKNKKDMLENAKKTKTYKTIKEIFDDAELVDVKNEEIND